MINKETPIVLTLDAGGTNLSFMAIQDDKFLTPPVIKETAPDNLDKCLKLITEGFRELIAIIGKDPDAISFAFPGPADYLGGVIGDLINIPCFRGGVPLGAYLENHFNVPVFINNDGDLFAYGEYMKGFLPELNNDIEKYNSRRKYRSLFGITLGTGFGGGLVINGQLITGENSASSEIWLLRNFQNQKTYVEEGVSVRSIKSDYLAYSNDERNLSPAEIFAIAQGKKEGNKKAAWKSFENTGLNIGEALANVIALLDCPIVIGGGISGASEIIIPTIISHLNGVIESKNGERIPRLVSRVFNIDDQKDRASFFKNSFEKVAVPNFNKEVGYIHEKKIPIGVSRLGTNRATALGAYHFAKNIISHDLELNRLI